jgi:hypothetical protein
MHEWLRNPVCFNRERVALSGRKLCQQHTSVLCTVAEKAVVPADLTTALVQLFAIISTMGRTGLVKERAQLGTVILKDWATSTTYPSPWSSIQPTQPRLSIDSIDPRSLRHSPRRYTSANHSGQDRRRPHTSSSSEPARW